MEEGVKFSDLTEEEKEKAFEAYMRKTSKVKRVDVSPSSHYPNWRYLCLECMKFHEKDYRMPDFRMQCDDCQKIQIISEIREESKSQ